MKLNILLGYYKNKIKHIMTKIIMDKNLLHTSWMEDSDFNILNILTRGNYYDK